MSGVITEFETKKSETGYHTVLQQKQYTEDEFHLKTLKRDLIDILYRISQNQRQLIESISSIDELTLIGDKLIDIASETNNKIENLVISIGKPIKKEEIEASNELFRPHDYSISFKFQGLVDDIYKSRLPKQNKVRMIHNLHEIHNKYHFHLCKETQQLKAIEESQIYIDFRKKMSELDTRIAVDQVASNDYNQSLYKNGELMWYNMNPVVEHEKDYLEEKAETFLHKDDPRKFWEKINYLADKIIDYRLFGSEIKHRIQKLQLIKVLTVFLSLHLNGMLEDNTTKYKLEFIETEINDSFDISSQDYSSDCVIKSEVLDGTTLLTKFLIKSSKYLQERSQIGRAHV